MLENVKQILLLAGKSRKAWIVPLALLLIIVALLVVSAQLSPLPLFLYPIL